MKKSCLIILILLLNILMGYSQITTNEQPISVQKGLDEITKNTITKSSSFIDLPIPDMDIVYSEDAEREKDYTVSQRTAVPIHVSLNLHQDGIWTSLKDGGKIWQLCIRAKDAKAIDFVFDKFWLPDGGKFFIFNPVTKETIGAVTSQYLRGNKAVPNRLSTGIVKGDLVVLEYYQPKEVNEAPIISISKVYYSYRDVPAFNNSCSYNVNVNCSEGNNWQREKRAVALVNRKFDQGSVWGSGFLVNNIQNNFSPLFITANHCLKYENIIKDAIDDPDLSDWVFYWGYETSNCISSMPPIYINKTTIGATVLANNNDYADFALLQLTQTPWDLTNYLPYHLGWDCSGNSGTGGVCIHHPKHDVKKISTHNMTPNTTSYQSSPYVLWGVQWISTPNGHCITEPGSSGSPLINNNHKVIGQLKGGDATCDELTNTEHFGKFSVSWTGNNNSDYRRRLSSLLAPLSNITTLDGIGDFNILSYSPSCNYNSYRIDYLPSGWYVNWSFTSPYSYPSGILQVNTPQTNQCTINNSLNVHLKGTLKAQIYNNNGNLRATRNITINTGSGFTGTYSQIDNFNIIPHNIPETIFYDGSTFTVGPKCDVYIKSLCFPGTTITHSGANLNLWNYSLDGDYGVIHLKFPYSSNTQYLTIKAVDNINCKIYEFYVNAVPYTLTDFYPTISTGINGQRMNILLGVDSEYTGMTVISDMLSKDVRWDVIICNAITGKVMYQNHVEGWTHEIDITGWESGIYIIKAQTGEHFVTHKVVIK